MICVECTNHDIDCLYYRYKSEYITLTVCPNCEQIADRYIEYDNVILFLDIFLLKPQAYRHLAYNLTEIEMMNGSNNSGEFVKNPYWGKLQEFIEAYGRYKKLARVVIVMILFDVYLAWAYEEKRAEHSLMISWILSKEIHTQYLLFIVKLIVELMVFHCSVQILLYFYHWKVRNNNMTKRFPRGYQIYVILITVLVASSIKLFPIVMLIWPYDQSIHTIKIINVIGFFNIVEALRIVTNLKYTTVITILGVSTIIQLFMTLLIVGSLVAFFSKNTLTDMITHEWAMTWSLIYVSTKNFYDTKNLRSR